MSFRDLVYGQIVPFVDGALMPLLYALAFLFFLIGVARYSFDITGDEKASAKHREDGRNFMLWGIIGFVVMFSVWGIIRLLVGALMDLG